MKRMILSLAALAFVAGGIFPAAAQKRRAPQKTREVIVYVVRNVQTGNGAETTALVPVRRRVGARTPVTGAIRALLADDGDEENAGFGVPYDLRLVSLRLKNGRAYINLAYDEDEIECCWGAAMVGFFYDAVEKTVLQFPEVKEVRLCANGIENFLVRDPEDQRKCPKN